MITYESVLILIKQYRFVQTARTRYADAQAAEARAIGAERTARERVEASISEREAAIERTRAACEAHYTIARRRFEAQLTAEHENALAQVKQETLLARSVDYFTISCCLIIEVLSTIWLCLFLH